MLNVYPPLVTEDLVFRSKTTTLQSSVSVMVSGLSGLGRLTEENVAAAMVAAEEAGLSRILVTDSAGRILFDTRETGSAVGQYALYTEVVQALEGLDVSTSGFENGAFRSRAASPVLYQNQIIGAVYAYEYDTEKADMLLGFQNNISRLSMGIAVAVVMFSVVISNTLTRQIRELLEAIRRVGEGAYGHRARVRGRDEFAQIGEEFNSLADRLQRTEESRRRFVSDASHELKTPLAAVRLLSDSILQTENIDPETTREFVADIGKEAERLSRITEDLLRLTRLDNDLLEPAGPVEILPVLQQVLRMMELIAEERNISVTYQAVEGCRVVSTRDELYQIIYNLTDNAVKYDRDGGHVEVRLRRERNTAVLTVADDGVGIPKEDISRIFQRFYRVDKARSRAAGGTGLGLAIVSDVVHKRGGSIQADNRPEGGAVFTVRWPLAQEEGGSAR